MAERRFNEEEVAAIFERATRERQPAEPQLAPSEGMTLAQLHDIGREVGVSADAITEAAHFVGQRGRATSRRILGLPLGVGRTVELGRRLTDEEWERLVVDLRETFDARGRVRSDGSLRQWTNGNLQALLEPSGTGHRVRMRTMKGQSLNLMTGGLIILGLGAFSLITGGLDKLAGVGVMAMAGAAMISAGALMLPGWARTRRRQMEEIAGRLTLMAGETPETRA
jgi:hypothetical protein